MNEMMPFQYQDVRLKESCWLQGKPYFTGRAIGEWLDVKHPDRYVHKIVERNPHILQFSSFVKLTSELDTGKGTKYEREQDIQVYDPIGLQLIVMESRQPKAIAYKIAVAHLVAAYMRGEVTFAGVRRIPHPPTLEGLAQVAPYVRGKGQAVSQLCIEMQKSPNTIRSYVRKIKEGKPIKLVKEPFKPFYIQKHLRDKYAEALLLRGQGLNGLEISRRLGVSMATIYRWIKGEG